MSVPAAVGGTVLEVILGWESWRFVLNRVRVEGGKVFEMRRMFEG